MWNGASSDMDFQREGVFESFLTLCKAKNSFNFIKHRGDESCRYIVTSLSLFFIDRMPTPLIGSSEIICWSAVEWLAAFFQIKRLIAVTDVLNWSLGLKLTLENASMRDFQTTTVVNLRLISSSRCPHKCAEEMRKKSTHGVVSARQSG